MQAISFDINFTESVFDQVNCLIRNVVLLGSVSKNNRRYTHDCMRNAVPLSENCQAFINHPDAAELRIGRRDIMKLAGKYINVRFEEDKVKGDFVGLPDDPYAKKYVTIAETMPDIAGNSQNARGRMRMEGGVQIVEELKEVLSVDLVAKPATTAGIFENEKHKKRGDIMTPKEAANELSGLLREDVCGNIVVGTCPINSSEKYGSENDSGKTFSAADAARMLKS